MFNEIVYRIDNTAKELESKKEHKWKYNLKIISNKIKYSR